MSLVRVGRAPEHRGPGGQHRAPRGWKVQRGTSQTAGPAVFLECDGAAGTNIFEAFSDGGLGFSADFVCVIEVRQVVEHIRQTVLWQGVDELVNILAEGHKGFFLITRLLHSSALRTKDDT